MPRNAAATLFIGNLDAKVNEEILHAVMIQAGPLVDLYFPRDKGSTKHRGYAFAEYATEESAEYAVKLFAGLLKLYGRLANVSLSGGGKKTQAVEDSLPQEAGVQPALTQQWQEYSWQGQSPPVINPPWPAPQATQNQAGWGQTPQAWLTNSNGNASMGSYAYSHGQQPYVVNNHASWQHQAQGSGLNNNNGYY